MTVEEKEIVVCCKEKTFLSHPSEDYSGSLIQIHCS